MLSWLTRLWKALVDAVFRTTAHAAESATQQLDVFSQLEADTLNLVHAVNDLKKFHFDPKWKTRVINAPRAIEGVQDIFDIVVHGFRDKFSELHQSILTLKVALEGLQIGHFGSPEPQARLTKITDWLGGLYVGLQAFEKAYKNVTDIATMVDDVKQRIETLDDLFLPQGNPKLVVDAHYRRRQRS